VGPGARQRLVERRRMRPMIRELEHVVDPLSAQAGVRLDWWLPAKKRRADDFRVGGVCPASFHSDGTGVGDRPREIVSGGDAGGKAALWLPPRDCRSSDSTKPTTPQAAAGLGVAAHLRTAWRGE
jgi:hypothetical protein